MKLKITLILLTLLLAFSTQAQENTDVFVIEEFSDNQRGWYEYSESGEDYEVTGGVLGSIYAMSMDIAPAYQMTLFADSDSEDLMMSDAYEMNISLDALQSNNPSWEVVIGFNRHVASDGQVTAATYRLGSTSWTLRADSEVKGALPPDLNLADTQTHSITLRVMEEDTGIITTLLIDGQAVVLNQRVPADAGENSIFNEIEGGVYFGIHVNGAALPEENSFTRAFFDNLILKPLGDPSVLTEATNSDEVPEALPLLGDPTIGFETEILRLAMTYPEGWITAPRPTVFQPQARNADIYNITAYNNARGFNGNPGEIGFILYEPAQVLEKALLEDSRLMPLETVLESFIRQGFGESAWARTGELETAVLSDGRETVQVVSNQQDRDRMWTAFRSSDESVTIMEIFTTPGELEAMSPEALEIAATVDYPLPDQSDLEVHEEILRKYLITSNAALTEQAMELMCSSDRMGFDLLNMFGSSLGGFGDLIGFAAIGNVDAVGYAANADGRYLETVSFGGGYALVRVMGTVKLSFLTGEHQSVPHNQFFNSDMFSLFSADVYIMAENSNGFWQVCPGAFG